MHQKLLDKYTALIEKFKQSLEKLEYIKNDDERTKKEQELQNEYKPELNFHHQLRINTNSHI